MKQNFLCTSSLFSRKYVIKMIMQDFNRISPKHLKVRIMHVIFSGSKKTVGEFFNPGLNCSDILDKCDDAKDGFYWITVNCSNPKKVELFFFCCLFIPFI